MVKIVFRHLTKIAVLVAAVMLFSLTVLANENSQALEYSFNDEAMECSVIGIGTCEDTHIVIPKTVMHNGITYTVTGVESMAFYNNADITSLTVSDTVKYIGEYAFHYCTSLKSVTLGSGLEEIGGYAFYFCTALDSLSLGGVRIIGEFAFYNCAHLDTLVIPNTVEVIEDCAFKFCYNIVRITLGTGLKSIELSAFEECRKAFEVYNLSSLSLYTIEDVDGVPTQTNAILTPLVEHKSLDEASLLIWSEGYVFLFDGATYYLMSQTGDEASLVLPERINGSKYSIGPFAFVYRTALEKIDFGTGVTGINTAAFYLCGSLKSIVIPEGINAVGDFAFNDCHSLTSVTLPSTLEYVGLAAFQNCHELKEVVLPDGVTELGENAFFNCDNLVSINLPSSLLSIGDGAFANCYSLTSAVLPDSLTVIEPYLFNSCEKLKYVYIPKSVSEVGENVFYGCNTVTICCEADSAGDGWAENWNNGKTVKWGYTVELSDAISSLGYSTNGTYIALGFSFNYDLIDLYEQKNGTKAEFGIIFASYELLGGKAPLDSSGNPIPLDMGRVIKSSLTDKTYLTYDFMLADLTAELYDHRFVIACYTVEKTGISYVQDTVSSSVEGKSYNQIISVLEEGVANDEEISIPML
ncbi:MAG: leucine-rich repeat domain-containing protein [Clostridia bacterium]|nr:leucine-rich repeat domain-containing protein [Clostridia bacterium]